MSDDLGDVIRELPPDDDDDPRDDGEEQHRVATAFMESLLSRAVALRASAAHVVPVDDGAIVRFRVDGVMQDWTTMPRRMLRIVTVQLKLLAELDIAERRVPQNGRLELKSKAAAFMLCTLPTVRGREALVLRRLAPGEGPRALPQCGYETDLLAALELASAARSGLVVVAGRSPGGRATTRYALLERALSDGRVVMTAEDGVRRLLPGATQVALDPHSLRLDTVLATIRRSDADVVMVSEIVDAEAAEWCVRRAIEGRLVIATVPVTRAADLSVRLIDMGLAPYLVADALRLVVAQRLVRRLCHDCRVPEPLAPAVAATFRLPETVHRPGGCDRCGQTGWRGRLLVAEGVAIGAAERDAIARGTRLTPPRTMRDHALGLVAAGETSLAEALAV